MLYCTNSFLPHLFHNKQYTQHKGSSVAEWLVCSTQAEKGLGSNRSHDAVGCWRCHRQTVHTHRASVHQAAKLVANLLRIARVTAGLAESNGSLPPGLWLTSHAGWLPRTGISSGTLRSAIEYGLLLPFFTYTTSTVQNTTVLASVPQQHLIHTLQARQPKFLEHLIQPEKSTSALYQPRHGNTRWRRPHTNYIHYKLTASDMGELLELA